MDTQKQGIGLFTALCVLIGTLVVIQLWLVAAAIEALLSGHAAVLAPAAASSAVLFLINAGLLWYVFNFDRRMRDPGTNGRA